MNTQTRITPSQSARARIERSIFARRRQALMAKLPDNAVVLVAAAQMQPRNSDVEYPFRQSSDFYYLTGFDEPDAIALLLPGHKDGEYVLFCQDKDPVMEVWHGYRAGPEGCMRDYDADGAWPIDDIDAQIIPLLDGRNQLYYSMGQDAELDAQVQLWLSQLRQGGRHGLQAPGQLVQLDSVLHEMRLIKSAEEAEVMREAGELSAQAHCDAMRTCQPGIYEYQLEAVINHRFAMAGHRQCAYPSIVGGGRNACVLHYTENNQPLQEGDLVLIDAGVEQDYYAADITRTFPVNGRFSEEQRAIYQLVLKAQLACIEACQPGACWNSIHTLSLEVLTEGLLELGLLEGELQSLIASGACKDFYMHRIGHWLGMDVHDVGGGRKNGKWRTLQSGMVLTIEPGLYIAPDCKKVEPRWRGIGVRIEDNVLITGDGHEVLTASVPKTVAEIEALMAQG
ncbi:MAG: Xaa-Pro aminopeptidase [Marinobacterium sp.]|nr:Xaa-Pro aminopeptidase [Marinobacterium sp.]